MEKTGIEENLIDNTKMNVNKLIKSQVVFIVFFQKKVIIGNHLERCRSCSTQS